MIQLENLTKIFETPDGVVTAADNINMTVPKGEICVLLGPSGCGKTTTLKMLNRIIPPTSGRVMINGEEVGVTNAEGVAHTVLDASPGQSFEVTLALADFERIRPQNVRETFTLGRQSDVFVFSPELTLEPLPRRRRRRRNRSTIMRIVRIE